MRIISSIFYFIVLFVAHSTSASTVSIFGKVINLKLNKPLYINDTHYIELNKLRDSRCPEGVDCAWEGQVVAELILNKHGQEELFTLILYRGESNRVVIEPFSFSIINVEPYPQSDANGEKNIKILMKNE